MVLKTFNVDEAIYSKFSTFCKNNGLSMSKQITLFMKFQMEEEPKVRESYEEQLIRLQKGNFLKVKNFEKRYKL